MKMKKNLVVYYSRSGNSKKVAMEISRSLGCDVEEIKSAVSYTGFWGYQRALIHAMFDIQPQIRKPKHNPADYDLVIVGGPVWGGSLSGPIRSFLTQNKNNFKNLAFFLTQAGHYGRTQVFKQMEQASGINSLANLSITDGSLVDENFRERVLAFLLKLEEKKPKSASKRVLRQSPPVSQRSQLQV